MLNLNVDCETKDFYVIYIPGWKDELTKHLLVEIDKRLIHKKNITINHPDPDLFIAVKDAIFRYRREKANRIFNTLKKVRFT